MSDSIGFPKLFKLSYAVKNIILYGRQVKYFYYGIDVLCKDVPKKGSHLIRRMKVTEIADR